MKADPIRSVKDLPEEAKRILLQKREIVADQGHEATPDEMLDTIHEVSQLADEIMGEKGTLLRYFQLRQQFELPPPPYDGWFETLEEAEEFRLRAEEQHEIRLETVPCGPRRWKVTVNEDDFVDELLAYFIDTKGISVYRKASEEIPVQMIADAISDSMTETLEGNEFHRRICEGLKEGHWNQKILDRIHSVKSKQNDL